MNPRILKKVCKKIHEMGHTEFKNSWRDDEFCWHGHYLIREKREQATAKQLNNHYHSNSSITNVYVVGGGFDYFGEYCEPSNLFESAINYLIFKYGEQKIECLKDEDGHVIDEIEGWPEIKQRLTAKKVIEYLKSEI